jgi:hypothetical protein
MQIVSALKAYGKPLSMAFLAHLLNRNTSEVETDVVRLVDSKVLKRSAGNVELESY